MTTRLDTISLRADGPDRVAVSGVRGLPPPPTLKIGQTSIGGFRNEMTVVLTGLDIPDKASLFRRQFEFSAATSPAEVSWTLTRLDRADPGTQQEGSALLTVVARDPSEKVAGRAFVNGAVELALASYPGFFATTPPGKAHPYGVFTAAWVPQAAVAHEVVHGDGAVSRVEAPSVTRPLDGSLGGFRGEGGSGSRGEGGSGSRGEGGAGSLVESGSGEGCGRGGENVVPGCLTRPHPERVGAGGGSTDDRDFAIFSGLPLSGEPAGPTRRMPLGTVVGARSGDKGGDANVGVWVRSDDAYGWLSGLMTSATIRRLLPETASLPIRITPLPNIRAVNIVIEGLLGQGVAYQARFDPQAKALGEWLRSRLVDIPVALLPPGELAASSDPAASGEDGLAGEGA